VLLMIANWSSHPATVPPGTVPDVTGGKVLLATHGDSTSLDLEPWESRIYLFG
jgi:oligo-1,6-glucosidase